MCQFECLLDSACVWCVAHVCVYTGWCVWVRAWGGEKVFYVLVWCLKWLAFYFEFALVNSGFCSFELDFICSCCLHYRILNQWTPCHKCKSHFVQLQPQWLLFLSSSSFHVCSRFHCCLDFTLLVSCIFSKLCQYFSRTITFELVNWFQNLIVWLSCCTCRVDKIACKCFIPVCCKLNV